VSRQLLLSLSGLGALVRTARLGDGPHWLQIGSRHN
jgi:hypothetical protein